MCARLRALRSSKIVRRHHFAAVADEGLEDLLQVQQLRAAVDQRHHVDAEGRFHRRLRIEVVEHDLGRVAALDLDVDAHAVLVGLVAQFADALELLSFTSSAIFSISRALLTWYGISVTTIASRPLSATSTSALARMRTRPRPVCTPGGCRRRR